ncbi:MAG: NAD(P)-dependent alcohol dehydrogenase [Dysgonomonas sp.]|nr:NAD(P)-dependent alcohol dehydrogenase [Dysgonomonas sp.]
MKKLISFSLFFLLSIICVEAQSEYKCEGHICTKGYAAFDAESSLRLYEFKRRAVSDNDILIKIVYSGICHSDIHTVKGDWGQINYPCVPGHEIVGRVIEVGKNVTKFKIGDIAGVGCLVASCGECEYCISGEEQFCIGKGGPVYTYNSYDGNEITQGGYSTNIVVKESFAIRVPDKAPLEKVAPLLCAGVTTFSPLKYNQVKKGDKIGVAGFGGLGHMAVQYAIAMGAEVTVFDITEEKRQVAMEMGASKYVNTTNENELKGLNNTLNLVLSTIPYSFEVETYLHMLKVDGTMVLLGVPAIKDIPSLNSAALRWRKKIYSSLIGGIRETQEMMDYSVENNIYPKVQIIPIEKVNDAYQNVLDGKVQFRYVIDMSSLK